MSKHRKFTRSLKARLFSLTMSHPPYLAVNSYAPAISGGCANTPYMGNYG